MTIKALALAFAASLLASTAMAQTPPPSNPSTTAAGGNNNQAVATTDADAQSPAKGSSSFTEGQARSRIADRGFNDVQGLKKDDNGVWHGTGMKDGSSQQVWMDYKGNVGTGSGEVKADNAAANPPGTAAGRAMDQNLGTNTTGMNPSANNPDGTPGNPPGTAAGRATDKALGTNSTGTNPPKQ